MRNTLSVLVLAAVLAAGCEEKQPPAPKPAGPVVGGAPKTGSGPQVMGGAAAGSGPNAGGAPSGPMPQVIGGAPRAAATGGAGAAGSPVVNAMGLAFTLPAGWKQVTPGNAMRMAEVQVPDASGDPAKMCTIVFSTAGGGAQANIDRWAGQVRDEAGMPSKPEVTTRTVAGLPATVASMTGAYTAMGETAPKTAWTLRGVIIETPGGDQLFVKMTGPAEPMSAAGAAFDGMFDSAKK